MGVPEAPAPLPFGGAPYDHFQSPRRLCLWESGPAWTPLSLSPTDIGPVTLTADPAVFQRELRELYVQVGWPAPAVGPPSCSSRFMSEAKVFVPPRGPRGQLPADSSACLSALLMASLGVLYFLGFFYLFSKTSTFRNPCASHVVGAYDGGVEGGCAS